MAMALGFMKAEENVKAGVHKLDSTCTCERQIPNGHERDVPLTGEALAHYLNQGGPHVERVRVVPELGMMRRDIWRQEWKCTEVLLIVVVRWLGTQLLKRNSHCKPRRWREVLRTRQAAGTVRRRGGGGASLPTFFTTC